MMSGSDLDRSVGNVTSGLSSSRSPPLEAHVRMLALPRILRKHQAAVDKSAAAVAIVAVGEIVIARAIVEGSCIALNLFAEVGLEGMGSLQRVDATGPVCSGSVGYRV